MLHKQLDGHAGMARGRTAHMQLRCYTETLGYARCYGALRPAVASSRTCCICRDELARFAQDGADGDGQAVDEVIADGRRLRGALTDER